MPAPAGASVWVRTGTRHDRAVITDLHVSNPNGIPPATLRELSLSRLEAQLNAAIRSAGPAAVLDAARSIGQAKLDVLAELTRGIGAVLHPAGEPEPRPRLTRPDGTNPDVFYRLVAAAYYEYAAATRAPAKEMAAEAGVPVTTAHRWIREARRRNWLPPAKQGRAG